MILDFGSQYTQLIARRIREFNVFSVVLPCTIGLEQIRALAPSGLILSGGPASVYDPAAPKADPAILELGVPTLGICYGLQFLVHHLDGEVVPSTHHEYGHAEVEIVAETPLFRGLPGEMNVWMSHGDKAERLPTGFALTAKTANAVAGIANEERRMWAVQFHPEVAHTRQGTELLRNFVLELCGARADWTPEHFIESTVARVRAQVGETGSCAVRAEWWGGFECGSGAGGAGDWGSADVHLCEQWRAAQGRVCAGAANDARGAGAAGGGGGCE